MSDTENTMEPDTAMMRRHVGHLFEGWLDGCHDGRIELAWTDGRDGKLRHAVTFGTDDLDELVDCAAKENRRPGQNVYVGPALRKPDVAPFGRCNDSEFLGLPTYYVDVDDDVVVAAGAKYRSLGCLATAMVVTGRHPHLRAQMLWRLKAPVRDPDLCRRQNLAIAQTLRGDPSVVNPSRVLRLGGSIAWPRKEGRIVERTELKLFDDGRPKAYEPEQIAKAFPLVGTAGGVASMSKDAATAAAPVVALSPSIAPAETPSTLQIGTSNLSVEACLSRIRAGDHWHDNLVRLTGHWIARGWSDAEILTAAEALTLPGYTVAATRREVATMLAGGRKKWNTPNPAPEIGEAPSLKPLKPNFPDSLNIAMLPRRRWLLGRSLLRGHMTLLVAPAGVGKSTHGIARAVAVATGRDVSGELVHEQVKTWVYNIEDDTDELKRRLGAVLQHWSIPFADTRNLIAINSGAERPLLFARIDRNGTVIRQPDVDDCIEQIRQHNIGLFVVDPFVETHEVNENSNEQIKIVAAMFREVARATNCAVLLVHHTAKPPQGTSDGHAGNMNTARGASALVGVARVVQTLFAMSDKDADRYDVPPTERHLYLRLDDAKANLGLLNPNPSWFRRVGVEIANGDTVGVLEPVELEAKTDAVAEEGTQELHKTIVACLLAQTSDDIITVNAAAKLLAWSGDKRFSQYRQSDPKGHQRAKRSLRDAVAAACRAGTVVVSGEKARGFTCDETVSPRVIKRFERALGTREIASQPAVFSEEDEC
jgi:hypothetical protein